LKNNTTCGVKEVAGLPASKAIAAQGIAKLVFKSLEVDC